MLDAKVTLKNRYIKTQIFFDEERKRSKIFESKGGRIQDTVLGDDLAVYMRQDFSVTELPYAPYGLSTAEISLWNLSDDSSREIESKGLYVMLEAGWQGETGELFFGEISSITRTKKETGSTDIVTTLFCKTAMSVVQKKFFQKSFTGLVDILSVLSQIAETCGLTLRADNEIKGFVENVTYTGDVNKLLMNLGSQFGFRFYFTQSNLIVKAVTPISQVKIERYYSPTSGLLDIPVVTEKGVDLKVFLDPQIRPGTGFNLDSKFANFNIGNLNFMNRVRGQVLNTYMSSLNNNRYQGNYQALSIMHEGSSHDNIWETRISAMGAVQFDSISEFLRLDIQ